uniref:EGF-like domain-containing protein n=1 Tax=Gopherus evgoodei TaxID=1825980 RepID=A0A8C4YT67_9SAUR
MDECLDLASCPAHAICTNTPGSHYCTCNTGFASSSGKLIPSHLLADVDECAQTPAICGPNASCMNTPGSYTCQCSPGHHPSTDGPWTFSNLHLLADVDECAQTPPICGPSASCVNTPGSYNCQCLPGHHPSTPGPWVPGTTHCTGDHPSNLPRPLTVALAHRKDKI